MNSPVRLGVSPAAASTPTGVFNQRFEALFPCSGALGCTVCFAPLPFFPVYLWANVGPQGLPATTLWGLLAATWPAPFHNPPPRWVRQPPPCSESSPPGCPSPPLLPVWMNVSSLSPWLLDFHTVRFSVISGCFLFLNCCPSFGCARRHNVSTYASILARSSHLVLLKKEKKALDDCSVSEILGLGPNASCLLTTCRKTLSWTTELVNAPCKGYSLTIRATGPVP